MTLELLRMKLPGDLAVLATTLTALGERYPGATVRYGRNGYLVVEQEAQDPES